jgi:hypothetical protein
MMPESSHTSLLGCECACASDRETTGVTDACLRLCACEHEPWRPWQSKDCQGDIIPAISMGPSSRMRRPSPCLPLCLCPQNLLTCIALGKSATVARRLALNLLKAVGGCVYEGARARAGL